MTARWTLGVTGDVGSGKTAVLRWLAARGAATLDADEVVHRLLRTDAALVGQLVDRFGGGVLTAAGDVDRQALARIVFEDDVALRDLEAAVHPRVAREVGEWLAGVPDSVPAAVVEAVKLVESGLNRSLDEVWLVICDRAERRRRLLAKGWSAEEIERRLAASAPLAPKLAVAARVIDNSGSERATAAQLKHAWRHHVGRLAEESDRASLG